MTKLDIVTEISKRTNLYSGDVAHAVELFMEIVKDSLSKGENVYLRGFGTFAVKERAEKHARNISANTTVVIPAHKVPTFKPSKQFNELVK